MLEGFLSFGCWLKFTPVANLQVQVSRGKAWGVCCLSLPVLSPPLPSPGEGAPLLLFLLLLCSLNNGNLSLHLTMYKRTSANAAISNVLCFRDVFLSHTLHNFCDSEGKCALALVNWLLRSGSVIVSEPQSGIAWCIPEQCSCRALVEGGQYCIVQVSSN